MLKAVLMAGAASLGRLVVGGSSPAGTGARPGPDDRRAWLESHPGEVEAGDIERVLRDHGLSRSDVRLVAARAEQLGTKPFTMWMFLAAYGAKELAVAVAAGMPHGEMLDCLSEGALPPFEELAVFARLHGLEAALDSVVA